MSMIAFTIRDASRSIRAHVHGSMTDVLVAALRDDPETIEEMQQAIDGFRSGERYQLDLSKWSNGMEYEPYDAGFAAIDLPGRLVVIESTYSHPGRDGDVRITNAEGKDDSTRYHLSEEWEFIDSSDNWDSWADARRCERAKRPLKDYRPVIYDSVCEFIVDACLAEAAKEPQALDKDATYKSISAIHAEWLMSVRDDLDGCAVRDVLLEKKDHIGWQLQDRSEQWHIQGQPAPALSKSTFAYRYGGFGTHELVVYYYIVRELIEVAWERIVAPSHEPASLSKSSCVEVLRSARDEWMREPNYDFSGHVPELIVEHERVRTPEGMTGAEAMIDHDCPTCQMMADMPGPSFWHLDGCNMDPGFAFSFHRTREEWEAEEREYAEFSRQCEENRKHREALGANSPWQTSYMNEESASQFPSVALFGFAAHLGELTQNLKDANALPELIDDVNRSFGNFREVSVPLNLDMIEPVLERLVESLVAITDAHPQLSEKCNDLEKRLRAYVRDRPDMPFDDEIPF